MGIVAKLRLVAFLAARSLASNPNRPCSLEERLAAFPQGRAPLGLPAIIRWNAQHVPYIETERDDDLAFCFGLVHAHLRLGQVELLRRIAYGRLAELAGAALVPFDHMLRALDFPRAAADMLAAMPETTLAWLDAFTRGLNCYVSSLDRLPHELDLLRIEPEPWRVEHVAAIGRLSAVDVDWPVWVQLLKHHDDPNWPTLWTSLVQTDASLAALPELDDGAAALARAVAGIARTGSNAMAIAGQLTASGKPILAADPHLPITVPNTWLLAGGRSPGFHAIGMMIPGLPFIASGRNQWIAWGGTSMHAATSDLVDVSDFAPEEFRVRTETVKVRWDRPRQIEIRESRYGPVITDCKVLKTRKRLALRWQGHRTSDEFTAMLEVNRASTWQEFASAVERYSVPALNMVYADENGNIGRLMAAGLPVRPGGLHPDIVVPPVPERDWAGVATSRHLPQAFNPNEGYIVSANDRPIEGAMQVGHFFSAVDRVVRMRTLIESLKPIEPSDIKRFHQDVMVPSTLDLRDLLVKAAERLKRMTPKQRRVLDALKGWNGHYAADSVGALAFELLLHRFAVRLYRGTVKLAAYSALWNPYELMRDDIAGADEKVLSGLISQALTEASRRMSRYGRWGGMHRLKLRHMFNAVPVIGRRYRYADLPAAGASETLMKTAHPSSDRRHAVIYGANARQICDLSDIDNNSFVLLGGQDGWLGSSTFLDQLPLWREGRYIRIPMRAETVAGDFPIVHKLEPAADQNRR
jgi:penicillin G amidase